MRTKSISLTRPAWRRLVELAIRYDFQSARETIEFLLDLAEETPYLERKVRAWKRRRGLI